MGGLSFTPPSPSSPSHAYFPLCLSGGDLHSQAQSDFSVQQITIVATVSLCLPDVEGNGDEVAQDNQVGEELQRANLVCLLGLTVEIL